jgi:rhodanese-related sulfurtransferase
MKSDSCQFTRKISKITLTGFIVLTFLFFNACKQNESFKVVSISAENVFTVISDTNILKQYIVLDVRAKMDYVRGHIGPAIWIASDSLKAKINTLSKDKSIIIYDSTGVASAAAAKFLIKNNFKNITVLEGGINEWIRSGYPIAVRLVENISPELDIEKKNISVERVHEIVQQNDKSYAIIDIRSYPAYKEGHIEGALSIPYLPINEFVIKLTEQNYPKNKPLIVYCVGHTCNISDLAIDVMLRNGYTEVYLLADGIEGWMSKGYPVEKAE